MSCNPETSKQPNAVGLQRGTEFAINVSGNKLINGIESILFRLFGKNLGICVGYLSLLEIIVNNT